jgi:histidine triad (HIT) family protein
VVDATPNVSGVAASCVFCDVVAGRVAAVEVLRDEVAVAFLDHRPLFPGHTLVIPVRHVETLADLEPDEIGPYFARVRAIAAIMPHALDAGGTFVANNNVVSQSVPHLHVHVVPRTRGDGLRGFFWPRRRYAAGEAEECAERLRRALAGAD